jgi:hypothetical protein
MKRIATVSIVFLFFGFHSLAQVKKSAYRSSSLIEMGWNNSKSKLVTLSTVQKASFFIFTDSHIYFKKAGNTKWLQNNWVFDKSVKTDNGSSRDTYYDERDQKIIIDYESSEVWYYHGYNKSLERYMYLTIYKDCVEDEELIAKSGLKIDGDVEDDDDDKKSDIQVESGKFRVDTKYVSVYDVESKKWSEWKEGFNTFIINANSNNDIIHLKASGKEVIYRRTSDDVQRKKTTDGKGYQIIFAYDENGNRFQFQVFDDIKIGIKMIYEDVMLQFASF